MRTSSSDPTGTGRAAALADGIPTAATVLQLAASDAAPAAPASLPVARTSPIDIPDPADVSDNAANAPANTIEQLSNKINFLAEQLNALAEHCGQQQVIIQRMAKRHQAPDAGPGPVKKGVGFVAGCFSKLVGLVGKTGAIVLGAGLGVLAVMAVANPITGPVFAFIAIAALAVVCVHMASKLDDDDDKDDFAEQQQYLAHIEHQEQQIRELKQQLMATQPQHLQPASSS